MSRRRLPGSHSCVFGLIALLVTARTSHAEQAWIANGGRAEAVIVVGREASEFQRWVAGELQRYVRQLSGAELPIVASDRVPAQKPRIVVGEPQTNALVAAAQGEKLVAIAALKPDGFVFKTVKLEGRSAIVVAGNEEAGTMYAAYELLERLGRRE